MTQFFWLYPLCLLNVVVTQCKWIIELPVSQYNPCLHLWTKLSSGSIVDSLGAGNGAYHLWLALWLNSLCFKLNWMTIFPHLGLLQNRAGSQIRRSLMEVLKKFCISPECVCGLRFKRDLTKDLFLHYQVHLCVIISCCGESNNCIVIFPLYNCSSESKVSVLNV